MQLLFLDYLSVSYDYAKTYLDDYIRPDTEPHSPLKIETAS